MLTDAPIFVNTYNHLKLFRIQREREHDATTGMVL